ncbi:type II secretion system protein [Cryobacterium tepidiphilum]|uniref:type II secretion system protein n=1 Tax=Cryobacterium tepidiphilum TaxID=2486026 RepID=UPI0013147501|nr:type II secretion system protein [Cryobacterium tepidiphilum]
MSESAAPSPPVHSDAGFGLIEVVVALMLFALLAVMMLPTLVNSLHNSTKNTTLATATQLLDEQLELARAAGDTCAALNGYESSAVSPVSDERGVTYAAVRSVDCPASAYPGTVKVTVTVSVDGSATPTAQASTLILVSAAS